jgi:dienelactone hydrolase
MGILFPSQRLESIEPCGIDLRGPRIRMARALKFPSGVVRPARSRTDEEVRVQTRSRTLSPRSRGCASPRRCGERSAASPRGAVDQPAAACELAAADSSLAIPIEEAYAATKYVAENGSVLNVDGSRLGVLGDSAGGNMAAAVTLLSKQRRRPKIAFQLLFYPVTDANFETGSYTQFQDGPWLTKSAMEWFWNAYLPDKAARNQLEGLPDALVITTENDVLRDEGEAYARRLWEAGVRVTCTCYIGTIHDFVMLNSIADAPAARGAIAQANAALISALQ